MSLPTFSAINVASIPQDLENLLNSNREAIDSLLQNQLVTWSSLMKPLEELDDQLHQFWSPIGHLHSVMDSDQLRENYQACLAPLTQYSSEIAHNKKLFDAVSLIASSNEYGSLSQEQQKTIQNQLRDFKLAGVLR